MQALLTILSIIIGLVFVLLLFSLLTSTVMEIIAAMLSLRGKHFLITLQNMLGSKTNDFVGHPFFKQLSYAAHRKTTLSAYKLPEWISKNTFSAVLVDILHSDQPGDISQKIANLPEGDLKKLLSFLYRQSDGTVKGFRDRCEQWFDAVMNRASDWYKRSIKWWLFGVGFVLAAIFNADTIKIYQSLSANSTLRQDFVAMAEKTVAKTDSVPAMNLDKSLEQATGDFKNLTKVYTEVVQSPLGLGWTESQGGGNLPFWLIKILGLLLTGIAVTFGAPFWFEVLKKLIAVKNMKMPDDTPSTYVVPANAQTSVVSTISGKKDDDVLESFSRKSLAPPPTNSPANSTVILESLPKAKPKSRQRRRKPKTPGEDKTPSE